MIYAVQKLTNIPMPGRLFRDRLTIKTFLYRDDMHRFLARQEDNSWRESLLGLKAGTYARAGGCWHNVRSLDHSLLAHV